MSISSFLKNHYGKLSFAGVSFIIFTILMASLIVPSGPASVMVKADFGTQLYSDTYISTIGVYCNNDNQYNWRQMDGNDDVVPFFDDGINMSTIFVYVVVPISRLATGGTYFDHVNVTMTVTYPNSSTANINWQYQNILNNDGTTLQLAFTTYNSGVVLSEGGYYRLSVVFKIEEP